MKNKFVQSEKRKKWIEFVQTLTHRSSCFKLWNTVKGLSSSNDKPPANRAIYFDAKKTTSHHDPTKCANKFSQQYTPQPKRNEKQKTNTLRTKRKLKIECKCLSLTVQEAMRQKK